MRDFSYNLAMADYEFRQIRTTNYIALGIWTAATASGIALINNGIKNSSPGFLPNGPGLGSGLLIVFFAPIVCIQIPPILNRPRTRRIQNYMYNARMIQESGMYQK